MQRTWCGAVGVACALGIAVPALAEGVPVQIAIENVASWDEFGEPINVVLTIDVAAAAGLTSGQSVVLTGFGFDLALETFGFSWLSEAEINLDDAANPLGGIVINPGDGMDFAGTESYLQPLFKLDAADQLVLSTGLLRIEFYEDFDDLPGVIDAQWNGTLTVQVIPAPSGAALLALAGIATARRRR